MHAINGRMVSEWTVYGPIYELLGFEALTDDQVKALDQLLVRRFIERYFMITGRLETLDHQELWLYGDRNDTYPDLMLQMTASKQVWLCDLGPKQRKALLYFRNTLRRFNQLNHTDLQLEFRAQRQSR